MNKFFTLLVISLFIGCLLFFNRPAANDEVVFWTLQMSDFAPYINGVIDDFEKENPNIKIKWIDVPFSEGEKRTLASVLSDNPPDLVNLNPDFSSTLAHKGALWQIPDNTVGQFNQEIVKSLRTADGKLYSIPWYATNAITIYNKDLIKNNAPQTYEQVAELAPSVRKNGAYVMLPNITENDTMLKILNKYGCSLSPLPSGEGAVVGEQNEPHNSERGFNSEKCISVFELFKNLYKSGLIPKETVTTTLSESLEKYMSGNVALIGAGANFLNMIKENAPSVYAKTDVAPQLKGDLGQNDFSLMNFVIPLRAKHKEQALKFALFLTNDKNQLELAKLTNVLAVNEKTLKSEFYLHYDEGDLMSKARVISASQLNKLQPVFKTQKNQKDINNLTNTAVQNILLDKGVTRDILDDLERDVTKAAGE